MAGPVPNPNDLLVFSGDSLSYTLHKLQSSIIFKAAILGCAHGEPFVIPTPSNRHILVSSEKDVKELSEAPVDQLSLHAVAKEVRPGQL
ncbi:MAG: hypothetical protein Q9213_002909 [Squamulea squamosa]